MRRNNLRFLALIVATVFLFQNCMTIIKGSSQKVPVTSNPVGARITIDGKEMGTTPLNIKVKRNKRHSIRAEMPGYDPLDIEIEQKFSGAKLGLSALGNYLVLGSIGALLFGGGKIFSSIFLSFFNSEEAQKEMDEATKAAGLGALLGTALGLSLDLTSGAIFKLSPSELDVNLTKIDGDPQPKKISMDSERFQSIKWIRVKLSPRETEILSLDHINQ